MLNTKKLVGMVRKWQKLATLGRKRITPAGADGTAALSAASNSSVASRGHVFVYTTDGKRFMVPLRYLNNYIFRELFKMSEEVFGLPRNGPITLPCDAANMEYIISLLQSRVSRDVERALVASIAKSRCTTSSLLPQGCNQQQLILYGF
ncbi:auxin-responsive protein SAUR64 [Elaeis guineensis]|uniref:Auxin-responsive protein SAUR64 n=1 Tax=Elaeis guineensis var. tenera TaxID=51953 RepID=A0A6I9S0X7_ELAGV|nr:auxin-responsive protein SAUR64 [Elaeis guineensis]